MSARFYETRAGRQLFEVTMPELVRQLARLNDTLAMYMERVEKQGAPPSRKRSRESP